MSKGKFGSLYRGILPPIFVEAPKRAIKFGANDQYNHLYKEKFGFKDGILFSMLTGSSAGMTEAVIVSTPDLIKIRMQDKRNAHLYKSTSDVAAKIWQTEGLYGFGRGIEATVWRHGVWNMGYFGVISFVRAALPKADSKQGKLLNNFIAGTIGGTVGTILNTPFDVVKTRVQSQISAPYKYNWAVPAIRTIIKEEGAGALYKGFVPKVLRLGPVTPFSIANVEDKSTVTVVVDENIINNGALNLGFRNFSATETLFVNSDGFKRFLDAHAGEYQAVDFNNLTAPAAAPSSPKAKKTKEAEKTEESQVIIGLTVTKEENFPKWYEQVLTKTEMLDYYDVSGCYIIRPNAFAVWKKIQQFFGSEIEELGVEDCYFPMFITEGKLNKEKDHIEGFSPEVAWVTRAGQSEMAEPIAIRPTSETAMYPYYATWIRSHRDLPLRLNQWCSVVRWEFKHPQPFLRTREFLWQEGHTAFATEAEADKEVLEILELYRRVYEELLAVPVVPGRKSENEKFAGGNYTTTVEGFIPATGRAIQGATSHQLGQNFSKMFEIIVDNENKERSFVWQNSWGLSTRSIGAMVMVHGDNKGLVMPPRVAKIQVVIVPSGIPAKASAEEKNKVYDECAKLHNTLKKAGIKVHSDMRDNYTPGFKFNHWELRGVPIRLEVGPKDIAKGEAKSVRRDTGEKVQLSLENIGETIFNLLETIQEDMFQKAKKERDEHLVRLETWDNFVETLNNKNIILSPWCERVECEKDVKERSARTDDGTEQDEKAPSMGAKTLCIPFKQPEDGVNANTKCFACGQKALSYTLWGRNKLRVVVEPFFLFLRPFSSTKGMTPPKNAATLKFLDSEDGHQLIEAVKALSEGIKGLEQFFKNAVPGAFEDSEHSKKHASKKRPRDPDAPKQPLSSYMIFVRDQRSEYKETNPGDKPLEVTEIGRRWRELDEKTKAEYAEQAEELKQKYNQDMKVYKAKLQGSSAVVLPPGDDSDDDDEVEEIEEHEDEESEENSEEEAVPEPPVKKTKVEKKPEPKADKKTEKKPEPKAEKKVEKKDAKPTPKLTGKPIADSKDKIKATPSKTDVESSPEKKKKKKSVAKESK
ncbi:hypothetical protein HDV04_001410 [Boothiomyces sp. JEL0838]|nr:hypothetical protein HDV04_001410 [Boothiomyces sp. JEL0838]